MKDTRSIIGFVAILLVGLVLGVSATFPNNSLLPGPLTGVHVTHSGTAIAELFIDVSCFGCIGHETLLTGATDTNGAFTFHAPFATDGSYQYIYKVTYGGQTYGIIGHAGQIIENPI